jgi:hypothetical protein
MTDEHLEGMLLGMMQVTSFFQEKLSDQDIATVVQLWDAIAGQHHDLAWGRQALTRLLHIMSRVEGESKDLAERIYGLGKREQVRDGQHHTGLWFSSR